jgi:hypothetical protein
MLSGVGRFAMSLPPPLRVRDALARQALPPAPPHVGPADDAAAGADHARAKGGDCNNVGERVEVHIASFRHSSQGIESELPPPPAYCASPSTSRGSGHRLALPGRATLVRDPDTRDLFAAIKKRARPLR